MKDLEFRAYDEEQDKDFVYASFLSSFQGSFFAGPLPSEMYCPVYSKVLDTILSRPSVSVHMAYYPEMEPPFDLYGYLIAEAGHDVPVVHYAYVKAPYRRRGIAGGLFQAASINHQDIFAYTFNTSWWRTCFQRARFQPKYAWYGERYEPPQPRRKRHRPGTKIRKEQTECQ